MVRDQTRAVIQSIRRAGQKVLADERAPILAIVAVGWMVVSGTRFVVPALLPQLTETFAISHTEAGFAITLIWLTYALMQFPTGILTDRWGERRLLTLSIAIGLLGLIAFAVAPVFWIFLSACVVFGFGIGLYGLPRVTLLSRTYPDNDGTAIGVTFGAGNIGAVVLPFVAGWLSIRYGWRVGFGGIAPLYLLVLAGTVYLIAPQSTDDSKAVRESPGHAVRRIASSLQYFPVLLLGTVITVVVFTWQGFTTFYPTYLVAEKGLSEGQATTLFGLFFATAVVVQPLAGNVADMFGARRVLLVLTAVATATMLLLPFVNGIVWLAVLAVLLNVRSGVGPINNAYLVAALPDDVEGATYGLLRTVYLGLGATGSIVVGAFADADRFDEAFLVLAGLTALIFGLYMLLPSRPDPESVEFAS